MVLHCCVQDIALHSHKKKIYILLLYEKKANTLRKFNVGLKEVKVFFHYTHCVIFIGVNHSIMRILLTKKNSHVNHIIRILLWLTPS